MNSRPDLGNRKLTPADNLRNHCDAESNDVSSVNPEIKEANEFLNRKKQRTKTISIVIPALNESDGIIKTIQSVPKSELQRMGYETQILVVDNGSHDGTDQSAKEGGAEVIHESRKGYGYAYKAGFSHASGDLIATTDADTTYPIDSLAEMLALFEQGNLDFLTTNRFPLMVQGSMSFRNKLGNKILSWAVRILFGIPLRDPESGMWLFKKSILKDFQLGSNQWPFSHEIKLEACYYNKLRWKEVPIRYMSRAGNTKLMTGWKVGFWDLCHIIKKRVIR